MAPQIAPLHTIMGANTVAIFVGKEERQFNVHRGLLIKSSKFFANAFEGGYREGEEEILFMPEDDADAFSYFVNFLYRNPLPVLWQSSGPTEMSWNGTRPLTEANQDSFSKACEALMSSRINAMLRLYFFAEKLLMNDLMNCTMDRVRSGLRYFNKYLEHEQIVMIYSNTCQGSLLRDFASELLVFRLRRADEAEVMDIYKLQQELPELGRDILRHCQSLATSTGDNYMTGGHIINPDPRTRVESTGSKSFHKKRNDNEVGKLESQRELCQGFTLGGCLACLNGPHLCIGTKLDD